MAARALIIAIESYSKVSQAGIASALPGTLAAGIAFREWMLDNWKLEGRSAQDCELLFCSEPPQTFGTGASRRDILRALHTIRDDGQGTTDTFNFYFSGHGFSFVERPGSRASAGAATPQLAPPDVQVCSSGAAGNASTNVVPCPGDDWTSTVPWWSWMMP